MHKNVEKSLKKELELIKMNIENEYSSIIFHKHYAREKYKEQLQNVVNIAISNIEYFYNQFKKGNLTKEQAQQFALESVEDFRFGKNDYFYIYNSSGIAISHPNPNFKDSDMSEYLDIKGNNIWENVKETVKNTGEGFTSFWFIRLGETTPVEKLSYNYYFKDWDWVIGTGTYIDDIQKEEDKRLSQVMKELKDTFSRLKIEETGYFFLFNSKADMIIHPTLTGQNLADFKHPLTGEDHLGRMKKVANTPGTSYEYLWYKPEQPGKYIFQKVAYVTYFKPLDWYIGAAFYLDEISLPARKIIIKQTILNTIIFFISVILAFILIRRITLPLKKLTAYANQLSSTEFSSMSETETKIKSIALNLKDEIGKLAASFAFMIKSLKSHIQKLTETTAIKEKIESELHIAKNIQKAMLPQPPYLIQDKFELYAALEPAKQIGGDLYDFFFIDENHFCFLVGDVSNKGIPAALFMSKSKTTIKFLTTLPDNKQVSPAEIMKKVNLELYQENKQFMFVTLFFAVLEIDSGKLIYANAGHNLPLFIRNNQVKFFKKTKGKPLGLKADRAFEEGTIILKHDDIIFLYTDGVTEAMNAKKEFFSDELLQEVLGKNQSISSEDITKLILHEVNEFSIGCPRFDDVTILTFKYKGKIGESCKKETIVIKNQKTEIKAVKDVFLRIAEENKVGKDSIFEVLLIIEEVLTNIISYSFKEETKHSIEIDFGIKDNLMTIIFTDDGIPFDPYDVEMKSLKAGKKFVGGKGIKIIKSYSDIIEYKRKDNKNILRIGKYLKNAK
ncbi:MAG: cache domain-containing protein [Armatimonadetes bacterium]|nr:cache domain-containing protein [Armatimonadota bacterium]